MSIFRHCDYCGTVATVEDVESLGWLRLEGVEGRRAVGVYPPLPRDFHSWECAAKYTADVVNQRLHVAR